MLVWHLLLILLWIGIIFYMVKNYRNVGEDLGGCLSVLIVAGAITILFFGGKYVYNHMDWNWLTFRLF